MSGITVCTTGECTERSGDLAPLRFAQFRAMIPLLGRRWALARDALVRLLRRSARRNGLAFELDMSAGKGSHYVLWLDGRYTTLQSGELSPLHVKRLLKQLDVDSGAL